jgi:phage shock protein A
MSIFSRIFKIGQAKANEVVDSMEKPELMLEQAIRDKDEQIRDAKKAIQGCIATERKTKAMLEQEKNNKFKWEQKAEAALKLGKEDLAVKALSRATEHEQKATSLQSSWEGQRASVESLKTDIEKLGNDLNEFKRNKDFIIAQSKAADVKKSIYEAKAKISGKNDVDNLMARMKAKAERTGYEAEAAQELAESFDGSDKLEKEFENLGEGSSSVEVQDKLAAMKAKLAKG